MVTLNDIRVTAMVLRTLPALLREIARIADSLEQVEQRLGELVDQRSVDIEPDPAYERTPLVEEG